ncbi:hypothetical protein B566_EDAN008608 [Ephemera danica]|nr:hypothetical protein B566_EDAN008608 [Ephemera danica]
MNSDDDALFSELVFLAEWWSGSDVIMYIEKEDFEQFYGKEHGYLIMNHAYDIDWLMGWVFCDRIRLLGNCKTYAKKVLQYIPTMGFAWKFGESVFLERNWDKDKAIIGKQLTELLLLFAEGTRFSEHKHEASMKFAKERGLPILKHHLSDIPRASMNTLLIGKPIVGHMFIQRIPLEQVPEGDTECANWLIELYQKKVN